MRHVLAELGRTVVTDRVVLLHMPKTGGTFLRNALRRELDPDSFVPTPVRAHLRWAQLPEEARDLPVLAFVRNPWDWYVSRFHYFRQWGAQNRPPEKIGATFEEQLLGGLDHRPGHDLLTERFDTITAGAGERLTVGRYERLIDDLVAFLAAHEVAVPDGFADRLRAAPHERASRHDHYRTYYTPRLRNLVAERCALVERFGYRF